ncbi:MAG: hypothetical protein PVI50_01305 [Gammaproteobacteria bacterium]|jgi:hypothetical protein
MCTRGQKLLLLLVTIALVAAPLRGSFAMLEPDAAEEPGHCARMQEDMPGMHPAPDRAAAEQHPAHHGCDPGCAGDCCDGTCGTCAHAAPALSAAAGARVTRYRDSHAAPAAFDYKGPTAHPPFRPPITRS